MSRVAIKPAKEAISGRETFRSRIVKAIGTGKNLRIEHSEKGLREQLAEYDVGQLKGLVANNLGDAAQALSTYENQRKQGTGKYVHKFQNFIKTFADFIGAYSGIVSLVRAGGQLYGELAYETLSLLFAVCEHLGDNSSTGKERGSDWYF